MRLLGLFIAAALVVACSNDDETPPAGTTGGMGGEGATGGGGIGGEVSTGGDGGAGGVCQNSLPNEENPPSMLSMTGLYTDITTKQLAPYVREFTPQYPLWSDGAVKTRWVYLPECDPIIDNTDPDVWSFPVGTRMWKQFVRDDKLIETRMVHRWGPGSNDFVLVTYVWDMNDADATRTTDGVIDAKGTEHDVPSEADCMRCHGNGLGPGGTPSRYLGFTAVQLSHPDGGLVTVTMQTLIDEGLLLLPQAVFATPGNAAQQAGLGYIYGNCGTCHNETDDGLVFPHIPMRLRTADADITDTLVYQNLWNVDVSANFLGSCDAVNGGLGTCPCNKLIDGMDPANSCVHYRMSQRSGDDTFAPMQMPPLGTTIADDQAGGGLEKVDGLINNLPD